MSRPTIAWDSDWARIKTQVAITNVVVCPDCGGLRYAGAGPHAPRWLDGRLVDCRGKEVAR
jgi:hypothetical protein